jgi:hypothetical protein
MNNRHFVHYFGYQSPAIQFEWSSFKQTINNKRVIYKMVAANLQTLMTALLQGKSVIQILPGICLSTTPAQILFQF